MQAALRDLHIRLQPAMQAALGRWIEDHVAAVGRAQRPVLFWHWGLTMWAWVLEAHGIHTRAAGQFEVYEGSLAEVGIPARARRQRPFSGWPSGRASMSPGLWMPGMAAQDGRPFGSLRVPLQPATAATLQQLAEHSISAFNAAASSGASSAPPL